MNIPKIAAIYLTTVNLAAFIVMGADKAAAKAHARRVPERVLLIFTVCCAGAGILLGSAVFRHKTRKDGLMAMFWTVTVSEILLIAAIYSGALF